MPEFFEAILFLVGIAVMLFTYKSRGTYKRPPQTDKKKRTAALVDNLYTAGLLLSLIPVFLTKDVWMYTRTFGIWNILFGFIGLKTGIIRAVYRFSAPKYFRGLSAKFHLLLGNFLFGIVIFFAKEWATYIFSLIPER